MTGDANGHQNGADGKGGDAAPAAKKEPPSHDKKGAQKDGDTPSDHHQPAVRASKTIIDPDKARDFQVRVKILRGRQVAGANVSPVTRVTCNNQIKQTRVQKGTSSPFWNEVFFFNFFISPAELFDKVITFGVYNSRKLRSDAFIGSFKCDVGTIYDEPQHSLINKWLLLSDPDDNQAGAKGYLKICASVLGPGDEAVAFKSSADDEDEDVEANLLRPASVALRPATFILKIYQAEDLPRMDSNFMQSVKKVFGSDEKKELVDPYFVFSFAGMELKSKILEGTDHPQWQQQLSIGIKFPSMCERIKLQMFDWDQLTADDPIGTEFLELAHVSATGNPDKGEEGFLPTFGPCFVNFYGSVREFSDLPDEFDDLNLGKGEGVAYRGRALVELQTILGEVPEVAIEDIHNDDILRVQKFLRRRKYKLNVAFLSATMVAKVNAPIEFEVSIGNYGNKLDETVPPTSSTTQATNSVFDGNFYYYLPWGNNKPCVVVDCTWQDISFRLETLNFLLSIIDNLETQVERLKLGLGANLATPDLARLLITLIDQLAADISKSLPQPVEGYHVQNDLDRLMRAYRESELQTISRAAWKLRESATDVSEALSEVEGFLIRLKKLAIEPQNSMPDIIIWMISGNKRIAYYRLPAYMVLWSSNPDYRGKYCSKLVTESLKYAGDKWEKDGKWELPGQLRFKMWLGLEKDEAEWHKSHTDAELAVFAETYENQVSILGKWTNVGPAMTRPKWSDVVGKMELNKESFIPPKGWKWEGDWYISPELSMLFDRDAGHSQFLEDVFECQSRFPGGEWNKASAPWTDVKGDASHSKDEIRLPAGWAWESGWEVDQNRAVDEEGWEYCVELTGSHFQAVERNYHMNRRRRWTRKRKLVKTVTDKAQEEKMAKAVADGWEYAALFSSPFHLQERTMDLVRRRRWHRKMIATVPGSPCFFQMKEDTKGLSRTAPRMFLVCKKAFKYQLRAYIYQARDLLAADESGLSDPFVRVSFLNYSQTTEIIEKTLCPTWDQTLIMENVEIHGRPEETAREPPLITIELFDYDTFGDNEFLGRTSASPIVKLSPSETALPVLHWYSVKRGKQPGGELLAAFELILMDAVESSFLPPKRGQLFIVPSGIRPVMQRTAVEVMCWGVRNMKRYQLATVTSPNVEFEIGGYMTQTKLIPDTNKNPNFDEPLLFLDIYLPKEELYTPPLNIRVRDNRQFGRKPVVGSHIVRSLEPFRCEPVAVEEPFDDLSVVPVTSVTSAITAPLQSTYHAIDMPALPSSKKSSLVSVDLFKGLAHSKKKKSGIVSAAFVGDEEQEEEKEVKHEGGGLMEEDIDWWSKYYASTGDVEKSEQYLSLGYDKLQILDIPLEKVGEYSGFDDFCYTFPLTRPSGKSSAEEEEAEIVGEVKAIFRVYPLPPDPNEALPPKVITNLPGSAPEECIVRVYVVQAMELAAMDPNGLSDPYILLTLGKQELGSNKDHIPNTLNPVFGKMFELKAYIPLDKDLHVCIKDYDLIGTDDIIGETVIDLENRLLSRHRATVGLPLSYAVSGPNMWRDSQTPKQILTAFCKKQSLLGPIFASTTTVRVGNRLYNLNDFESSKTKLNPHLGPSDERLALHVLHSLPASIGMPLVPEHVEVRPLYSSLQPGIEQGKLQMWVDIFPVALGPPGPPVNIAPRQPKKFEIRVIMWNTHDVILNDESITGEKCSDIYVKGWVAGHDDESQETDVHYRSLDGEGNFNWRFVFPFDYMPAENVIVVKKKEHFWSLDATEFRVPPNLVMQIWDNDLFGSDNFLGAIDLNMARMPAPARTKVTCNLKQLDSDAKMISLFEKKRIKGFWPCFALQEGEKQLTGKVEIEIELLTEEEATEKPSGKARDDPNQHPHLDPPKRPDSSFLGLASPWKALKQVIWKNYKKQIITGFIILIIALLLVLFFYSFPGAVAQRLVNAF